MVAAAAQEGNLEDSDLAVAAFRMTDAGMGRRGWVERTGCSKPAPREEQVPETHVQQRRWRGAGGLEQAGMQRGKANLFRKTGNLRGNPLG